MQLQCEGSGRRSMNRKQRKATKKRKPPRPPDKFKADSKTVDLFYDVFRLVAMTVLHDKYGFGKSRLTEFDERWMDLVESVTGGFVSIYDLNEQLAKETGILVIERERYKRKWRGDNN